MLVLCSYTYTPAINYNGPDSVDYTVTDGILTDVGTLNITVTAENDEPVAVDDSVTTNEDTPITILVLDNDSDIDGDEITVTIATSDEGLVVINSDGTITFTPNLDFVGEATVSYTISDGNGGTDIAIVTITILEDISLTVIANEICINDTPYVNYAITPVGFSPSNGATITWRKKDGTIVEEITNQSLSGQLLWPGAVLDSNGVCIAWPGWEFTNGVWVEISDGLRPEMELVISVNPETTVTVYYPPATPQCSANPNNPPVAVDDSIIATEDVLFTSAVDLDFNDTDVDLDALTVVAGTFTTAEGGILVLAADGSYTYTPATNYNGPDSIDYTVSDGTSTDVGTLNITVTAVNNMPVAVDDSASTTEGVMVTIANVLTNDTVINNATITSYDTTSTNGGTVTYNGDGTFDYTPLVGFVGDDSFTYTLCDDDTPTPSCDIATITIFVGESLIKATNDSFVIEYNTTGVFDVLENDSFSLNSNISITRIGGTATGNISFDSTTKEFIYSPNINETGSDVTVEYQLCYVNSNGSLGCSTAIITIIVPSVIDLELVKEVDNLEPFAESNVNFTIDLTNMGPNNATGVEVQDLLPSGYRFVSYVSTVGSFNENSGIWNVGDIANLTTETLVITTQVLSTGDWENITQVVASNELDLDSTPNNDDSFEDDYSTSRTNPKVLLTIPEEFSPNGDGINDFFEIKHLEVLYPKFSMDIHNRWGNKVYVYKHNGDPNNTPEWWNGFSDGRWNLSSLELPAGTYFYTIYFNNNERKPKTGWIYLRK